MATCLQRSVLRWKNCVRVTLLKNNTHLNFQNNNKNITSAAADGVVFSGIQPTGVPHIGNYFGAIKYWVKLQQTHHDIFLSIVDLHSMTMPHNPAELRQNIRDMACSLLACGIDPERTVLFQQSTVPQHAELGWILGCLTTLPRLQHLPQWKQKSETMNEVPLGLFTYPVLQAADILLYKATDVPVGDDQVKHIELSRHLAKVFNNKYGQFFPEPQSHTGELKRIKSLRNPDSKMSKSEANPKSRIELIDTPTAIHKKLKKSVTDSNPQITYDPETRPGVSNLVDIYGAFTGKTPVEVCSEMGGLDTVACKAMVAEVVAEQLSPIRDEIIRLAADPGYVEAVLEKGRQKAAAVAEVNYEEVKKLVGFT